MHPGADNLLQQLPALAEILFQIRKRLGGAKGVGKAVGGDFVAPVVDFADQMGKPLGDPAENKERGLGRGGHSARRA